MQTVPTHRIFFQEMLTQVIKFGFMEHAHVYNYLFTVIFCWCMSADGTVVQ